MIWWIFLGMLASFGGLCALWGVFGGLFSGGENGILIFPAAPGGTLPAMLRRVIWLREMGLLRCRIVVADRELSPEVRRWLQYRSVELYDPARGFAGEIIGENDCDGTGNGDSAGYRSCCCVSEL